MRNSVLFATIVLAISCTSKVNLVPETPSDAPDYLCTWNLQGYVCSYGPPEEMRAQMTERYLFGNGPFEGWTSLYPQIRQDLYFVMDDSWDIPADRNERWDNPYYGTARLDTSRFPSFRGTPEERLKALSDSVKGRGWKGLGGWICAQKADTDQDVPEAIYWGDRLREAQAAGVRYWKVDWGRDDHNRQWRIGIKEKPPGRFQKALKSGKRDSSPRLRLGLPRAFHVTPAFLTEGCPSGASGSLGRAVVSF